MKHLTATYRPIFRYGLSRIGGLLVLLVLLFGTTRQALAQQFVFLFMITKTKRKTKTER